MNRTRIFFTFLLLALLSACSMSADQEASLSSAVNEYIDARNNQRISMWVRLTYPEAVRFYKNQGDAQFIEHFKPENNLKHYQDGNILEIKSEGKTIHVLYEFVVLSESGGDILEDVHKICAISVDEGKHWKFLDYSDYKNNKILPKKKRLIKS